MATVLCTGIQGALLNTRKLVLEHAGHHVFVAMNAQEIIAAGQKLKFDVAIIGQSTDARTKRQWAALIRQHCPGARILEIYIPHLGASILSADAWLESPAIPAKLKERIAELITKKGKRA